LPLIDRVDRSELRMKAEDEASNLISAPPTDIRAEKRKRKYATANRTRYRTANSVQDRDPRQPSLFERFTGLRL
jgi:hypothetical protein